MRSMAGLPGMGSPQKQKQARGDIRTIRTCMAAMVPVLIPPLENILPRWTGAHGRKHS